jgi:poly(A) polymerase
MTALPSLQDEPWLKAPELRRVFAALAKAGGEARVAGGAVRNALLKEPVADIDIATTLDPEAIMKAGKAGGLGVHPTGLDHGTITLTANGKPFEVTTLRIDTETFGRKARVKFTTNWEADARRRDFTVNALYCDRHGKILDLVDGYKDILRKRIRFIDDPSARIKEDYLRILRFFRFHAHYGKGAPDREGLAACIRLRKGLDSLSAERVRQELFKLMVAPRAVPTLRAAAKARILEHVLPYTEQFVALQRMAKVDIANGFLPDPVCRIMVIAAEPDKLKARLRLSNEEGGRIQRMAGAGAISARLREKEQRAVLFHLGEAAWRDCVRLQWARSRARPDDQAFRDLYHLPERWPVPVMPVHGRDLIDHGLASGPALGAMLQRMEDWWVASDFKPGKKELLDKFLDKS